MWAVPAHGLKILSAAHGSGRMREKNSRKAAIFLLPYGVVEDNFHKAHRIAHFYTFQQFNLGFTPKRFFKKDFAVTSRTLAPGSRL